MIQFGRSLPFPLVSVAWIFSSGSFTFTLHLNPFGRFLPLGLWPFDPWPTS